MTTRGSEVGALNKTHPAEIVWRGDDVPVSTRFEDPYYSLQGGAAEAAHVFIAGNGLPDRFARGFRIAELGFGTGLNAVVALRSWRRSGTPGNLRFESFEAFPMDPGDMARALAAFPDLSGESADLIDAYRGPGRSEIDGMTLRVVAGDARETLPRWDGTADAWFLDGFAPSRNPELWEPALLSEVARHTSPGGTFATYSAAGAPRRALTDAGFDVERAPGFGRKRHMMTGRLR